MNSARLSIVAVFTSCSFLLSWSVSANAQDLAGEDPAGQVASTYSDPVTVDDLTEEQFTELASLSVAVRSAAGVSATSGNITNDVAAILALLQAAVLSNGRVITVPYTTGTLPLQNYLFGLGENWTASSASRSSSFLYEIQRALYGVAGVPSASDAIQPLLYRLVTNSAANPPADFSFTNDVAEIVSQLEQSNVGIDYVLGSLQDLYQESSSQTVHVSDIYNLIYSSGYDALLSSILAGQSSFTNWIDDFEYGHGSQWGVHVDDTQWGDLLSAISDSSSVQTNANSGPQETVEDIRDILQSMQESLFDVAFYAEKIHEIDLDYEDTDRSVRRDFGYWNASNQTRSVAVDLATIIESLQAAASGSYSQLTNEVETAYSDTPETTSPTNSPLPSYLDFVDGNQVEGSSSLSEGANAFSSQVDTFAGMVSGSGSDEIVVIPEMTIGGIHVAEHRFHLSTSITPVCRRIMSFIWAVALFASLFALASSEWAFYANLGRNWTSSGGFHETKGA